jgi:hypothetical protein
MAVVYDYATGQRLRESIPTLTDIELHDTLLYSEEKNYLRLQKFQGYVPNMALVTFHEFPIKSVFFNGEFRLLVTPEGRVYFEEMDARISTD